MAPNECEYRVGIATVQCQGTEGYFAYATVLDFTRRLYDDTVSWKNKTAAKAPS